MRKWLPPLLAAIAAAVFLVWHSDRHNTHGAAEVLANTGQTRSEVHLGTNHGPVEGKPLPTEAEGTVDQPLTPSAPSFKPASPVATNVAPLTAELAGIAPGTVIENMRTTIRQYGAMFGGNPVGTNPEITNALRGQNPKGINFLKADGNRVNDQGELVDSWGTPYFFHQISATEMEIRSAGPDRIMYTADDL